MGCDIVFKINGELRRGLPDEGQLSRLVTIKDSSLLSDTELLGLSDSIKPFREVSLTNIVRELLKSENVEKKIDLVSIIKNLVDTSSRSITAEDIQQNGIVGNYKFHTLKSKYPELFSSFTLLTPFDPDILLVDKLFKSGTDNTNMIIGIGTNENPVFVVKDSKDGVRRLLNYLRTRDFILNEFEGNPELETLMPELAKVGKKFNSLKELLIDFISRNSDYKNLLVEKGAYGLLKEITTNLNKPKYNNPLDREFSAKLKKIKGTKSDYTILKTDFINLVKIHTPELILNLTADLLKNDTVLAELFNKFYENFTEFVGKFKGTTDKGIIILKLVETLGNRYGFTYSTISELVIFDSTFRGFNIYKYTDGIRTRYMFSLDVITPSTITKMYNSIEEILNIINLKYDTNITFSSNFEPEFRMIPAYERVNAISTTKYHAPGSVVKILNIELDKNTILDTEEKILLNGDSLLKDFYNHFKKQLSENLYLALVNTVDSIETAGIFIYLINERAGIQLGRNLLEGTAFEDTLSDIQEAKNKNDYNLYFILDCSGPKGNYFIKMIPIKSDVQINEKYSRPEPIIGLINEIIDTFNEKFKIGATLLTLDEISEQFPDIPAGTKAFIREGNIYINGSLATSEDVIHEYTHLFLGVLKALNYDMYTQLLDKVMNSKLNSVGFTKSTLKRIYPNLANSDLNEEVFVKLFADFLSGKRVSDMFKEVKAEVDSEMKSIFTLATEEDFNSLYRGRVKSVFETFSKDIGKFGNGLDFSKGTVFRQAANWISKGIESNNITESC